MTRGDFDEDEVEDDVLEVMDMAASLLHESVSQIPMRFCVGDTVDVLRSVRLPKEDVIGTGVVERITPQGPEGWQEPLYWISGFPCAKTARCLRLVRRAR